jgi:oligoendopeptidase F
MEFCEVASMTMERWAPITSTSSTPTAVSAARAKRDLRGVIRFLPWIATIDSFQHWIYTHPPHTRRSAREWLACSIGSASRRPRLDGLRSAADAWHRQLHLFHVPFYYIEYGIAQLGALQLWMKSKENPAPGAGQLPRRAGFGRHPPPARPLRRRGIPLRLLRKNPCPLMNAVREELDALPE